MAFDWLEFRRGVVDILPVVTAALPIGLLFGTLAAAKGISPVEAMVMSATVYGGAAQFVAVDLWTNPAPVVLLTLTVFLIQIRHIMMGVSFARHMGRFPPWQRPLAMFFLVDEVWAFAERRALGGPVPPAYWWGMSLALWGQWVVGTTVGSVLGRSLGDPKDFGFDFAFTATFICILIGFIRSWRTGAVLAASGIAAALAKLAIPGAWYIAVGGLAGVAVAYLLAGEEEGSARKAEAGP
jgi:4-azaleucine resistance transporter AzlC